MKITIHHNNTVNEVDTSIRIHKKYPDAMIRFVNSDKLTVIVWSDTPRPDLKEIESEITALIDLKKE